MAVWLLLPGAGKYILKLFDGVQQQWQRTDKWLERVVQNWRVACGQLNTHSIYFYITSILIVNLWHLLKGSTLLSCSGLCEPTAHIGALGELWSRVEGFNWDHRIEMKPRVNRLCATVPQYGIMMDHDGSWYKNDFYNDKSSRIAWTILVGHISPQRPAGSSLTQLGCRFGREITLQLTP